MASRQKYNDLFGKYSDSWDLTDELFAEMESFTCHLYGDEINDINHLCYKLYCSKKGRFDCEKLPPCLSSLYQHSLRANCQCKIWRSALLNNSSTSSPNGHGWIIDDDDEINIKWMDCNPAPEEVYLNYLCSRN